MKRKLFSLFIAALMSASMWATEGALSGRFTINAGGEQIVFSQGNLQYKDGTGWRFAEHQWDFISAWNTSDWIDLFGWGTGANPTLSTWNYSDYSTFVDWGTNAISNGGNTANEWYSLSLEEWSYIFNTRANASNLRGHSTVNGINGYVLLPDGFSIPDGLSFTPVVGWGSNVYTEQQWAQMEAAGAVFFPASGCRVSGTSIGSVGEFGGYYTSSNVNDNNVYNMSFGTTWAGPDGIDTRCYGRSVRLVRSALEQEADGYYLIGSVDDWKDFANLVQTTPTANAKMTADINLGNDQTMIGSLSVPYAGIFDGQGHTLTFHYNTAGMTKESGQDYLGAAPFRDIEGATIRNLNTAGSITVDKIGAAGLVGWAYGTSTIENCWSDVNIVSSNGTADTFTGFVAFMYGTSINIKDCIYTGLIQSASKLSHAGFIGYRYAGSSVLTNCIVILDEGSDPSRTSPCATMFYTFDRYPCDQSAGTYTNCYYYRDFGGVQGIQATAEQLADGTIAYNLQNDRADLVWGQRIGIDAEPVLTNDESYRVYISKNGGYTNDPDEALQQDGEGYFLLGSVQDWKAFAELINSGITTANAKMTADIDLGDDQTMIGVGGSNFDNDGSDYIKYQGTFDGQGHTLTIHYVAEDHVIAPFRFIEEATIKNLRVDGDITTAFRNAAGIVGICFGQYKHSYIENCISSVNIISSYVNNGDFYDGAWHGGIAARLHYHGQLHITDCIFNGSISGENKSVIWGGMLGIPDGTAIFTNCLQVGTFDCSNVIGGYNGSGTISTIFSGLASSVNISNCYYLNALGNVQGTQATAEQLADGTTATALQAGRAEEIWVQDGATPMLKLFITPIEAITSNEDPDHAGIYYSTFFDGSVKYELPVGVEAYVATLSNDDLVLTKIAEGGQVMPANTAVILKSDAASIMLTPSTADAVTFTATNSLQGTDVATAAPANCYVLSGHSADNSEIGVGFYQYTGTLKAHRAYVTISNPNSAPKRLRFVFDSATAIENTEADVKAEKRIENGVLYIIKNGVKYNAQGQTVK